LRTVPFLFCPLCLQIDTSKAASSSPALIFPLTPSNTRYMIASMNGEILKGHLDFLLLSILADGAKHGYAVIEALRQRSGGHFDLPEGTIYPALHRLEEQGLLKSRWEETAPRRRKVYTLTVEGHNALAKRQAEWAAFSKAVNITAGV
jgi:PadR family transcriptional regulator, regulatory protein PadR